MCCWVLSPLAKIKRRQNSQKNKGEKEKGGRDRKKKVLHLIFTRRSVRLPCYFVVAVAFSRLPLSLCVCLEEGGQRKRSVYPQPQKERESKPNKKTSKATPTIQLNKAEQTEPKKKRKGSLCKAKGHAESRHRKQQQRKKKEKYGSPLPMRETARYTAQHNNDRGNPCLKKKRVGIA
jgi:hypothetical protein